MIELTHTQKPAFLSLKLSAGPGINDVVLVLFDTYFNQDRARLLSLTCCDKRAYHRLGANFTYIPRFSSELRSVCAFALTVADLSIDDVPRYTYGVLF